MATVDQVAALDPAGITPVPFASRLIGACAVGVALLLATATFLVLAGLTPIAPVDSVVRALLLGNVVTGLLLLGIIGREVWKETTGSLTNTIDVYINSLRKKVEQPERKQLIHTVRGVGYVLRDST